MPVSEQSKRPMRISKTLRVASILPAAHRYQLWNVMIVSVASVIGIILLPVVIPFALWAIGRYYERLEVVLTQRDLQVRRGIFNREEKTIPLEKITDLALTEGPLMRIHGVKGLAVETAGQSSAGALVRIIGIEDVEDFRDAVLEQRDRISENEDDEKPPAAASTDSEVVELLSTIRDSVLRIEKNLSRQDDQNSGV